MDDLIDTADIASMLKCSREHVTDRIVKQRSFPGSNSPAFTRLPALLCGIGAGYTTASRREPGDVGRGGKRSRPGWRAVPASEQSTRFGGCSAFQAYTGSWIVRPCFSVVSQRACAGRGSAFDRLGERGVLLLAAAARAELEGEHVAHARGQGAGHEHDRVDGPLGQC